MNDAAFQGCLRTCVDVCAVTAEIQSTCGGGDMYRGAGQSHDKHRTQHAQHSRQHRLALLQSCTCLTASTLQLVSGTGDMWTGMRVTAGLTKSARWAPNPRVQ